VPKPAARRRASRITTAPAGEPDVVMGYRRISHERAGLLGDLIATRLQDEGLTHAFCELLEGLTAASFEPYPNVESLASIAAWRAYALTFHFSEAFRGFRQLPPLDLEEFRRGGRESGGT
jgi:hypothetical protein